MIKSFASKETQNVFYREFFKKLPNNIQKRAYLKLENIHLAGALKDLKSPPSNHLEKLSGDRKNQYSIRVNDQWRICFEWQDGHAGNVEIVDYH